MSLTIVHGDLLKSDCGIICHQANCQTTMRSGIAKSLVELYPEVAQADKDFPIPSGDNRRLGRFSHVQTHSGVIVVNLYGQFYYGTDRQHTDYAALEHAVREMLHHLSEFRTQNQKVFKVGLPYNMGCGLAGGDWNVVREFLERASNDYQYPLFVYRLQ